MIDLDDVDTDEDGALTATAVLPGERRVTVEYEFDEELERPDDGDVDDADDDDDDDEGVEPEDLPDLDAMQDTVQHALARLTEEILDGRERDVAEELADAAQEDGEDLDYDELLQAIREDLVLDGVIVFGDGGLTLLYVAASEFPDLVIHCLLDEDLEIDDLMVE